MALTESPRSTLACWSLASLLLGMAQSVWAAEAETDVIGQGSAQFEVKLAFSRDKASDQRERATPLLARVGLSDSLELRLATDGRLRTDSAGISSSGWSDVAVGLRGRLQEATEGTGAPSLAWQLELGLPTGSGEFRAPSTSVALKFAAEWGLADDWSVAVMPGLLRQRNEHNDWYLAPSMALTLGKGWGPDLRTVVELVAPQLTSKVNGGHVVNLNIGLTYRLTDKVEWESVYTRGLTQYTPDHALLMGFNFKF